jgi:hypothetical protein
METKIIVGLLALTILLSTASAAPFTVSTTVNGVDPSSSIATVTAGEPAQITVNVVKSSPDVTITGVQFSSSPSAMAGILEAFVDKRVEFPKELDNMNDANSYELPGFLPSGEYDITATISYSGSYQGTMDYNAKIQVENEGILNFFLGLIMKVMPKFIMKPIAGLAA